MHGLSGASIKCQNHSTRKKVIINNYDGGDFDCASNGLVINPGDKVKVIFNGRAD